MPNLMLDFTKGVVSTIAPDSITELKSSASDIFNLVIGGAKTATGKYREIRHSGGFKRMVDWFFHRGEEFEMSSTLSDNTDDEFDAGFQQNEPGEKESSQVLDYRGMQGLVRGQVSAMYEIGGKQAEASAMTTSEIITTVNTRSSEILSSLSSINSNLEGIVKKLDSLIELQQYDRKKTTDNYSSRGIFDSSGNITLGSAFDFVKQGVSNKTSLFTSAFSAIKSFAGSGMVSRGELLGMGVGMMLPLVAEFVDDHRTGGKNKLNQWFSDTKDTINETIQNVQNKFLTKLLDWDKFQNIFGNLMKRTPGQDYSSYIENQYNRDRAVFDGMTRKTIIDVIPGYLKRITHALTGQEYNVSPEGTLTTEKQGDFRSVFRTAISDGMSSRYIAKQQKTEQLSDSDIYTAQRVLIAVYVGESLNAGININKESIFEEGGMPIANQRAIDLLDGHNGKSRAYWSQVVGWIIANLQLNKNARGTFTRVINKKIQETDRAASQYASTATYVGDIGKLDNKLQDDILKEYLDNTSGDDRTYGDLIDAGLIDASDLPAGFNRNQRASDVSLKQARNERMKQSELIGGLNNSYRVMSSQTIDYVASIFDILNRGINVYADKTRTKPYKPLKLTHIQHQGVPMFGGGKSPTPTVTPPPIPSAPTDGGGQQQPDSQPEQQREPTFFDNVKEIVSSPFKRFFGNVKDDFVSMKDSVLDAYGMYYDRKHLEKDLKNMGNSEDEKHDQQIAEAVLAAMQTAAADGDTAEDLGALSAQISEIKDPELRSRLQSLVTQTLSRNANKKPMKSKIGKILMWGFGIAKKFILPKLKAAKTFITTIFSKAKSSILTIGKKIVGPIVDKIVKSLKNSLYNIKSGIANVREGYQGLKQTIKDSDIAYLASEKLSSMKDSLVNKASSLKEKITQSTLANYIRAGVPVVGNALAQGAKNAAINVGGAVLTGIDNLKDAKEKLTEKLGKTEFGKGFLSAFDKEANKPKTVADKATSSVAHVLTSKDGKTEGGGDTILSKIFGALKSIGNIFTNSTKEITDSVEGKKSEQPVAESNGTDETTPVSTMTLGNTSSESTGGESGGGVASKIKSAVSSASNATKGGVGFNIGKMLGGMTKVLMGIGQAVLTVIATMSGFKAIVSLITGILKNSLKPLNKAFQTIYKALKPIVKTITKILKEIVGYVVEIVESVVKIIQPIMEAIGPIIEQLMSVLSPILEMLTGLVNVIMIPLVAVMKSVVVPVLQTVANTLEIILGVVEVGMGLILTVLGGILCAVGLIGKLFGAGDMYESGKNMISMGTGMVSGGWGSIKSGFTKQVQMIGNALTATSRVDEQEQEEQTATNKQVIPTVTGSPMDGTFGNGDIYGGAGVSQAGYGNYMNMKDRGCGPVALADAYARRSGNVLDARQLAVSMSNNGTYNTANGTSVSGYMHASNALGMNVKAGGVTQFSLKQASPSNPITVLGSGPDFSTRKGNNHYMNVIGSKNGIAYVSNPLTGRVERRSASSLASSSVVGLYGSGDSPIEFSDTVQEALGTLKDIVGQLVSIFMGGDDTVENQLAAAEQAASAKQALQDAGIDLSNMSENDRIKLEQEAREIFKQESAKYEGESDAEYEQRFQKNINLYYAKAAQKRVKDRANTDSETINSFLKSAIGETDENGNPTGGALNNFTSTLDQANQSTGSFFDQLQASMGVNNSSPDGDGFYSDRGARLATDTYTPSIFEPNIPGNQSTSKSQLHEFFTHTNSSGSSNHAYSAGWIGHWFRKRQQPNTEGIGQSGKDHSGIDFLWTNDREPEIVATTGGTVLTSGKWDPSTGNTLIWKDSGGDKHHYYHLKETPYTYIGGVKTELGVGDKITGGQVVGRVGSTGESTGAHLHYTIIDAMSNSKTNPMTFFKWHKGEDAENDKDLTDSFTVSPDDEVYGLGIPVTFTSGDKSTGEYVLTDSAGNVLGHAMSSGAYTKLQSQSNAYTQFRKAHPYVYAYKSPTDTFYLYDYEISSDVKRMVDHMVNLSQSGDESIESSSSPISTVSTAPKHDAEGFMDSLFFTGHETRKLDTSFNRAGLAALREEQAKRTTGSGDTSTIAHNFIPPLDNIPDMMQYSDTQQNPVIVNRYSSQMDTQESDAKLKKLMNHTFNVKSEKIETTLDEMLKLMREKNKQRQQRQLTKQTKSRNEPMPEERIPTQVERLSIG